MPCLPWRIRQRRRAVRARRVAWLLDPGWSGNARGGRRDAPARRLRPRRRRRAATLRGRRGHSAPEKRRLPAVALSNTRRAAVGRGALPRLLRRAAARAHFRPRSPGRFVAGPPPLDVARAAARDRGAQTGGGGAAPAPRGGAGAAAVDTGAAGGAAPLGGGGESEAFRVEARPRRSARGEGPRIAAARGPAARRRRRRRRGRAGGGFSANIYSSTCDCRGAPSRAAAARSRRAHAARPTITVYGAARAQ